MDAACYATLNVIFERPKISSKVSLRKSSPSVSDELLIMSNTIKIVNEVFIVPSVYSVVYCKYFMNKSDMLPYIFA